MIKTMNSSSTSRASSPNGANPATNTKVPSNLWCIHGDLYDLSEFVERHPGGSDQILIGKGRDCTELFESVHALSDIPVAKMLSKYKVKCPPSEFACTDTFAWNSDGFFKVCSTRVKTYLQNRYHSKTQGQHKATLLWWIKAVLFILGWFYFGFRGLKDQDIVLTFISGILSMCVGFNVMHDASHFAVSRNPKINHWLSVFWNGLCGWNQFIWYIHHVYAHHSYTGIHGQDPDISNSRELIRKHSKTKFRPLHSYQAALAWFIMMFLPNQHTGQSIQYIRALFKGKIFGIDFGSIPKNSLLEIIPFHLIGIIVTAVIPIFYLGFRAWIPLYIFYISGMGSCYFFVVAPNHDGLDVHMQANSSPHFGRDWGAQQLLATCNHSTTEGPLDLFITHMFGGMNYQIEHHLFPTMSHVHYPEIAPIVRQTAKEFGIPYTTHTWGSAIYQYAQLLRYFSSTDVRD